MFLGAAVVGAVELRYTPTFRNERPVATSDMLKALKTFEMLMWMCCKRYGAL